ncbi:MAG: hypothetical protein HZB75_00190 [Candidatus Saccharibacteria bacterium]|nr:MAG: hypothetical protein HZB75_00190 [Candidatus Saccharibacteria bacterium]
MQLAPSKNPEKESKSFTLLGASLGLASILLWYLAIAGLAFCARGAILSHRINNIKLLIVAIAGLAINLTVLVIHFYL